MSIKLNLGCGSDIRENYINVDLKADPEKKIKVCDVKDLSPLNLEDNSVDEIIALDLIEYLSLEELGPTLSGWYKKLKKGGTLTIRTTDYSVIGNAAAYEQISINDLNALLYGDKDNRPKSIYNLTGFETLLSQSGCATIDKCYHGHKFFIQVEKI